MNSKFNTNLELLEELAEPSGFNIPRDKKDFSSPSPPFNLQYLLSTYYVKGGPENTKVNLTVSPAVICSFSSFSYIQEIATKC